MDEKFAMLELDPALPPFDGRIVYLGIPESLDELLDELDDPLGGSFVRDAHASARTNVDWKETATEHVFKADIPGVRKEDVQVQVKNGKTLIISGQRKKEELQKTDTWHLVERSSGPFMREFLLPENANTNSVTAKLETGVLTVVILKVEKKAQVPRNIEIGGSELPADLTNNGGATNE